MYMSLSYIHLLFLLMLCSHPCMQSAPTYEEVLMFVCNTRLHLSPKPDGQRTCKTLPHFPAVLSRISLQHASQCTTEI
ncbi:hypothetical protein F4604DRAFT_1801773, partial [Suillus subluteus]